MERLLRGTRPISRNVDAGGGGSELVFPVGKLMFQSLALELVALPGCVISVLRRKRRKRVGLLRAGGVIVRRKFVQQSSSGPSVEGDVVDRDQQQVIEFIEAKQRSSDRDGLAQVERFSRFFPGKLRSMIFPLRVCNGGEIF